LKVQDFPKDETVVVVDPPRKGCSNQFLEQLYKFSPQRIVYMSCGPATQARDAKGIIEIGGYTMTSIQPFDLFPQTKHIESLIVFEKKTRIMIFVQNVLTWVKTL
jgi:23S rRNA (uracil1939-C5)-methyltransferase/tRNA (uracil-5-)-methyltransferase